MLLFGIMRFVVLTQIFWYIWVFWWGLSFLMWSEVSFDFASVLWSHIMFLFVCQGDQARNFFLQSGLPPPILAQIWWVTSTGSYNQLWNIRLKITQWWSSNLFKAILLLLLLLPFEGLWLIWTVMAVWTFTSSPSPWNSSNWNSRVTLCPRRFLPVWNNPHCLYHPRVALVRLKKTHNAMCVI